MSCDSGSAPRFGVWQLDTRRGLPPSTRAEVFVDVLSTLHTQGKVRLLGLGELPPSGGDSEMIGWRKDDVALVIPEAAHRRVAIFAREAGEHWAPSLRELHKELVQRSYALSTPDGRDSGQWRVGPERREKRGWLIPVSVLGLPPGPRSGPDTPPADAETGDSPDAGKQLELHDNSADDSLLPPLPPNAARAAQCWQNDGGELE
jgi:hypothetical protein